MQLFTFLLSADSWEVYDIYNGSTNLNPWKSFKDIAGALLAIGFFIRAIVIFRRVLSEESGEGAIKGVYSLIMGILAITIITYLI